MDYVTVVSPDGDTVRVSLGPSSTRIGRSNENELVLRDPAVSRSHAMIERRPDGYFVTDLGGRNGTYVNEGRADEPIALIAGDTISLGNTRLVFNRPSPSRIQMTDAPLDAITRTVTRPRPRGGSGPLPTPPLPGSEEPSVMQFLFEADQELVLHRPLNEMFTSLLDIANRVVPFERGAILTLDGSELVEQMTRVPSEDRDDKLAFSSGITQRVLDGMESLLIRDALEDTDLRHNISIVDQQIRSAMCVPLRNDQAVLGLLYLDDRRKVGAFNEENLRILTHLANIAAVKIENKRLFDEAVAVRTMEDELRRAATIQCHLLPQRSPEIEGYTIHGISRPGAQVGGDFFAYYELSGDRQCIALGDVAGKGLSAALLMCSFESVVSVLAEQDLGPRETVAQANRTLSRKVPDNRFITLFFGALDIRKHRLTYVNAGQNVPVIVGSDSSFKKMEKGGIPLGMFGDSEYRERTVDMRPGDVLVLYSDGVTEAVDCTDDEFGVDRLVDAIQDARDGTPRAIIEAILGRVDDHEGDLPQADDITLVVLKRSGSEL